MSQSDRNIISVQISSPLKSIHCPDDVERLASHTYHPPHEVGSHRPALTPNFLQDSSNSTLYLAFGRAILDIGSKVPGMCTNNLWQRPQNKLPFFLSNVQDAFCGYPNFDITCKHEYPVLGISNDDYIIKDIFYNNQTFLVASAVAYEEDTCPTPLHNLTLDLTPFNISPDYFDFYFLYNCTSKPTKYLTYPIRCATNSTVYSFAGFHIEKLEISSNYSLDSCNYFVNAPLHTGSDLSSLFHKNYTEILKMGFLLNWTAHTCSTCEGSGGRCGFENHEFVCFCHDRTHLTSCDDGNSS
ncbi:hypothetical protein GH714_033217 [Hevea brasiliensis]|uniref:non-specific serine/threonine protein kinase n=1 Tax=Hevea brasiliensis TaxID=3981 RepID=A0A6A6L2J5_HEVBR|nr:hypothetical protein GH714_033217 [Hevea brasiliensis]